VASPCKTESSLQPGSLSTMVPGLLHLGFAGSRGNQQELEARPNQFLAFFDEIVKAIELPKRRVFRDQMHIEIIVFRPVADKPFVGGGVSDFPPAPFSAAVSSMQLAS